MFVVCNVMRRMRLWGVAGHGQSRDMEFLRSTAPEMDGLFDGFNSNYMVNHYCIQQQLYYWQISY
jgi:hypothetical protein